MRFKRGDAWVDRSLQNRNEFNTEFQEMITRHVWGDIWSRPGIDPKTRRFMVLSIICVGGVAIAVVIRVMQPPPDPLASARSEFRSAVSRKTNP